MDTKFKIAYWLTDKKKSKLKINQIEEQLNKENYQLIRIQKPDDFEFKGPFSVFFHKLTDITINSNSLYNTDKSPNYSSNDQETENWIQKYKVMFDYFKNCFLLKLFCFKIPLKESFLFFYSLLLDLKFRK